MYIFEAYHAKFEASTYTKFTKDHSRTIAVTNKRLGTGQAPFREKLMRPHFVGHRVKTPVLRDKMCPPYALAWSALEAKSGDFLSGFFWSLGRWQQPSPGLPHGYNYIVGHVQTMSKRKHSKHYGEMTIPLLKQELRLRKAKLSGKKHQLIERLESYDRNDNFGHQLVQAEQFNMNVPEQSGYKDINSETRMPTVTEQVKIYMDLYGQDLKENSKAMYKAKFLRSIRLASQKENVYICGRVSAEMYKKCIYNVDIQLDSLGVVQQCQCECAAGMGPEAHCKHVGLVLHALTKLKEGIITQSLDCRNISGYDDQVRSIWLNSTATNPPIRQMYAPANVYAIANDHDYQDKSPEDMFLQSIHITAITHDEQESIEIKTRGQGTNKFWREERLLRLHASIFGRICTATDRTDFSKLAESLTQYKNIKSSAIIHGRKYEAVACDAYSKDQSVSVNESGIVVSLDVPYIGCSPGGLVGDDGMIEIKCPYTACNKLVIHGKLLLKVNHDYYYQVQMEAHMGQVSAVLV
ncbi:hypothetical protein LSH36_151g07060 [Paralvinella palmiformis]|uniref:SWIM-type domain-containing protein n=1 Tax=Paralvinella palmiformis TaxID=53620 RepID=A0AAD9N9Z7_9ANNE|nr:hypothetical protein LSH36_151g07060 [Paralvinella palmiformis]